MVEVKKEGRMQPKARLYDARRLGYLVQESDDDDVDQESGC